MANTKLMIANIALQRVGGKGLTTFGEDTAEGNAVDVVYDTNRDEVLGEFAWGFAQKRVELVDITIPDVDDWVTATVYAVDDEVYHNDTHYTCLVAHTSSTFAADLASVYWIVTTDWVTATAYYKGDQVYHTGISYTCVIAHTAGTFATDVTALKWVASQKLNMDDDDMDVVYYKPTDFIAISSISDTDAIVRDEVIGIVSDTADLKMKYTYQCDDPTKYHAKFIQALAMKLAYELCFIFTESRPRAVDILTEYHKITLPKAKAADARNNNPMVTEDNSVITTRL